MSASHEYMDDTDLAAGSDTELGRELPRTLRTVSSFSTDVNCHKHTTIQTLNSCYVVKLVLDLVTDVKTMKELRITAKGDDKGRAWT